MSGKAQAYLTFNMVLCFRYVGATLFGTGIFVYETSKNKAEMAKLKSKLNLSDFMATPLTDISTLENSSNDMKTRMEIMIMKIQVRKP